MGTYVLSKSSFIKGVQCQKQLYLYKYHYNLREEIDQNQQAVFTKGWEIGSLARELFPGGVDLQPESPFDYDKSAAATANAIRDGQKVIYEAAFIYDGLLIANDILVNDRGKWKAYEVKSSTEIKEPNLLDAALQYFVINGCGLKLDDISIVYINNRYTRRGELNVHSLFNIQSVYNDVLPMQDFVKENLASFKLMLKKKVMPDIDINENCGTPYGCSFMGYCWKDIPEHSVFDLAGMKLNKKFDLYRNGILRIKDIPDDYPLTEYQQIQTDCEKSGKPHVDKKAVKSFLRSLKYPLYFMDFETFNPAVPLFNGTRPYQQIPFQYSVHRKNNPSAGAEHFEFLAEAGSDPRQRFIVNLLRDIGKKGDIIVYNQNFEISRLRELAADFPKYEREIERIISRIKDLMELFRSKSVYYPEFNGSYSIKSVLPVLVPDLSYDDLPIGDGGTASLAYESLQFEKDQVKVIMIRENLLRYCEVDTLGMVRLVEVLNEE